MGIENLDILANSNERGMLVERNILELLKSLDYVKSVRQTTKDGPEDKEKIDLVVELDSDKKKLYVSEISVQVKASTTGATTFRRDMRQILKDENFGENLTINEWMVRNRIILLIGDVRISRSRKTRWPITEEEIRISFENQLGLIDDYQRKNYSLD